MGPEISAVDTVQHMTDVSNAIFAELGPGATSFVSEELVIGTFTIFKAVEIDRRSSLMSSNCLLVFLFFFYFSPLKLRVVWEGSRSPCSFLDCCPQIQDSILFNDP
jgi:hypothetical protein